MRLSEAIRLGAMAVPPSTSLTFYNRDDAGQICGACALATAAYAIGDFHFERHVDLIAGRYGREMEGAFPLLTQVVKKPWHGIPDGWNVGKTISGLYESARWTRERIADWVEQLETSLEPAQAVAAVDPVAASQAPTTTRDRSS